MSFIFRMNIECNMLYNLELQMAGIILFSAMIAGGIAIWYRRRRALSEGEDGVRDASENL